eukprot:7133384-Alexandrium_andersonii.AAC.1
MSASLVGSEMCIRDSSSTACRRAGCTPVTSMVLATTARRTGASSTPPGPVSYTHLTLPTICSV